MWRRESKEALAGGKSAADLHRLFCRGTGERGKRGFHYSPFAAISIPGVDRLRRFDPTDRSKDREVELVVEESRASERARESSASSSSRGSIRVVSYCKHFYR